MDEKRKIKPMIIIVVVLSLLIVGVIVWFTVTKIDEQKNKLKLYDYFADIIEDYSFVMGSPNTVKCEIADFSEYERMYIYNGWRDPDRKVELSINLSGERYNYDLIFQPASSVCPFPKNALPVNAETRIIFTHYISNNSAENMKKFESAHFNLAVSFNKPMCYNDIKLLKDDLIKKGYVIKFCWVDTYIPSEIYNDSVFTVGLRPDLPIEGYEDFSDCQQVYGFLMYDGYYDKRNEYDNPAQKFIDIVNADHDVQDSFMASEMTAIRHNLMQKDQLSADKLEIIGIVLEKNERDTFTDEETEYLLNNYGFIKQIISD